MSIALYVFPTDTPSDKAIAMAKEVDDIEVIDISMEAKLPPYVNGVPLLADEKMEYRGTACLERLKELQEYTPRVRGVSEVDISANFVGDLGFKNDVIKDPKKELDQFMKERNELFRSKKGLSRLK